MYEQFSMSHSGQLNTLDSTVKKKEFDLVPAQAHKKLEYVEALTEGRDELISKEKREMVMTITASKGEASTGLTNSPQ